MKLLAAEGNIYLFLGRKKEKLQAFVFNCLGIFYYTFMKKEGSWINAKMQKLKNNRVNAEPQYMFPDTTLPSQPSLHEELSDFPPSSSQG